MGTMVLFTVFLLIEMLSLCVSTTGSDAQGLFGLIHPNRQPVFGEELGLLLYNEGTVCDDKFDNNAANIICRQMGFVKSLYWESESKWQIKRSFNITLDDVVCPEEGTWHDCTYNKESNCEHNEDVFLSCERPNPCSCKDGFRCVNGNCFEKWEKRVACAGQWLIRPNKCTEACGGNNIITHKVECEKAAAFLEFNFEEIRKIGGINPSGCYRDRANNYLWFTGANGHHNLQFEHEKTFFCRQRIDTRCDPNPCKNGGVCANTKYSYSCQCPSTYSGKNCLTDVDECVGSTSPCDQNAVCKNTVGGYECTCRSRYNGDGKTSCKAIRCSDAPCLNGGVCKDTTDTYLCECANGYTGMNCETATKCHPNPCHNKGTCKDISGSYSCECADGYIGNNCDTIAETCLIEGTDLQQDNEHKLSSIPETHENEPKTLSDCVKLCKGYLGKKSKDCKGVTMKKSPFKCYIEWADKPLKAVKASRYNTIKLSCLKGKTCNDITCQNNGICKLIEGYLPFCECADGYMGQFCETKTNHKCTLVDGDGTGGDEKEVFDAPTEAVCINKCMMLTTSDITVNGVTVRQSYDGRCWCEKGMLDISRSSSATSSYKTCFLDPCAQCYENNKKCENGKCTNEDWTELGTTYSKCEDKFLIKTKFECQVALRFYKESSFRESSLSATPSGCGYKKSDSYFKDINRWSEDRWDVQPVCIVKHDPCKVCYLANQRCENDLCITGEKWVAIGDRTTICHTGSVINSKDKCSIAAKALKKTYRSDSRNWNGAPAGCHIEIESGKVRFNSNSANKQHSHIKPVCFNNPDGVCKTVDGDEECIFPFEHNGVYYHKCIKDDHHYRWCITKTSGGIKRCRAGAECDDIDECATNPCHAHADCTNTHKSYRCSCKNGFIGDGKMCADIDECATSPCHENADCTNIASSYTCKCRVGYTGDGTNCTDTNECATNPCHGKAACSNNEGSYTCTCNDGYSGDGTTCTAICTAGTHLRKDDNNPNVCDQCPENTYSNDGAIRCEPCKDGKISSSGSSGCHYAPCTAGNHLTDTGCQPCPANTYSDDEDGDGLYECKNCDSGLVSPSGSTSSSACKLPQCSPGKHRTENGCELCPLNTYSVDESGKNVCKSCPDDKVSDEGSTSIDACYKDYNCWDVKSDPKKKYTRTLVYCVKQCIQKKDDTIIGVKIHWGSGMDNDCVCEKDEANMDFDSQDYHFKICRLAPPVKPLCEMTNGRGFTSKFQQGDRLIHYETKSIKAGSKAACIEKCAQLWNYDKSYNGITVRQNYNETKECLCHKNYFDHHAGGDLYYTWETCKLIDPNEE